MSELRAVKLDEALLTEVHSAALKQNKSIDQVVEEALLAHLRDHAWTEMLDEARERTARLGIREEDVDCLIAQSRREHSLNRG